MMSSTTPQKQAELHSDLPIPPGEYLAEVLAAYAMSHADLARRMDCSAQTIDEIVQGQRAITREIALQLEQALRVPAAIWIGLETEYQHTTAGAGSA